ncbi:hypothetical protein [Paraburkholderia sp. D1E]|uniref:hypothetical protein n=1 Tax=Paraburkholderia sp. D1E TaxID=3461398 RepID=UPI0040461278
MDDTLETASSNHTTNLPIRKKPDLIERVKRTNRLFMLTVVLPTAISILYFGLVASDVFVSESRFVVRSPSRQAQTSVMGALLQGTGFARAEDDTYPVIDFIQSRDALRELNHADYIRKAYGDHGDFLSRFPRTLDDSFEGLWKYYGKHVVLVDFDPTSAIATVQVRAFTAEDAKQINESLLEMSERLINRMNQRAASDAVQFAQGQVDTAASKAKDAAAALATFRNSYTIFDPDRQSALQLQQVTSLQTQLFAAQTQLVQLESIAPQNPQIAILKTSIATIQKQIDSATGGVSGGKNSLSDKAAGYARLQLDAQFSDKQLASALTALDNAKAEAQRKQLYLERLVQPNQPDVAIEPKRIRGILTTIVLGFIAWGALSLLIASIREHRD